jgi:hypothetical protein
MICAYSLSSRLPLQPIIIRLVLSLSRRRQEPVMDANARQGKKSFTPNCFQVQTEFTLASDCIRPNRSLSTSSWALNHIHYLP